MISLLRSMTASLGGYMVIALGTSLTFSRIGILSPASPPAHLAIGTLGAILSGVSGGAFAAFVAPRRKLLHVFGVL